MATVTHGSETTDELPPTVYFALDKLQKGIDSYDVKFEPLSSLGENSYGQILQVELTFQEEKPKFYIVKISPKNEARRKQMKVVDYYSREVFIYERVLPEYSILQQEYDITEAESFSATPKMFYASLKDCDEFLIFENLQQSGFNRFNRRHPLTFYHTSLAIKELAKFHAMSLVMKSKKPRLFFELVDNIKEDNLFNDHIEPMTIEFGKKYIEKTIQMMEDGENVLNKENLLVHLNRIRDKFDKICCKLVNGTNAEPYSVICHGDFWNNNILYEYDECGSPIAAKILDFQMSRYASPALDFVHYLFTCTEKVLRDEYFEELKMIYHSTLSDHLKLFRMDPDKIFSYSVFEDHLKQFGLYGFCISVYAIPFFISDSEDIPDLDEVSEAVSHINDSSDCDDYSSNSSGSSDKRDQTTAILETYEFLTNDTIPIFKRRMNGIVLDLDKYDMLHYDF